ncbi:MAG TPA: DUF4157 domain-containing protein [Chitinophagaceae bacterium]|jgi:hypothetical protein
MKPAFTRRFRRRSSFAGDGSFFKRGGSLQTFFDSSAHESFFQPAPKSVQRKCEKCEEEEKKVQRVEEKKDEEEKKLQKKGLSSATTGNKATGYINSLNNRGEFLSKETQTFFGSRMGYDFSNVKIHTEEAAARSAKAINAKAYTTNNHIVFNEGQYNPASAEGKKLIAHELTHIMQNLNNSVGILKRKAEFKEGPRTNDRNLAGQYIKLLQGDTDTEGGSTHPSINGVDLYGNVKTNPINIPAEADLKTSTVNNEFEASVSTLPTNTTSYSMHLPQKEKWKKYADVDKLPGVFGQKKCNASTTLVLVSGDPDNTTILTNVETHEDVHVSHIKDAHKAVIEKFDDTLKAMKLKNKDEKKSKTLLLKAITTIAAVSWSDFIKKFEESAAIFHGKPAGKKLEFSKPEVDSDCMTVKGNVR